MCLRQSCVFDSLTWAGLLLWKIVMEGVELQTTQQRQAGNTLFTASKWWEGRGRGKCHRQEMVEQGQSTCHIALGQVCTHQTKEGVGLTKGETREQISQEGHSTWWWIITQQNYLKYTVCMYIEMFNIHTCLRTQFCLFHISKCTQPQRISLGRSEILKESCTLKVLQYTVHSRQ